MKELFLLIKADLQRSILSFNFVFTIIAAIIGLWLISLQLFINDITIVSLHKNIFNSDYLLIFYPIAAITYSASFCVDWDNDFIKSTLIRTSVTKYSFSKIIACFISSFLAIAFGCGIFLLFHSLSIPLTTPTEIDSITNGLHGPFENLVLSGNYISYFLIKITIASSYFALYAVATLYVSTYITNVFVVYATPLILHYLIINLNGIIKPPVFLNFIGLIRGSVDAGGILLSFLYAMSFPVILSLLLGLLFKFRIGRRLEDG